MNSASLLAGGAGVAAAAYVLLVGTGLYDPGWGVRAILYDLSLRAGFDTMTPVQSIIGTLLQIPLIGGIVEGVAPKAMTHPFGPYLPGTFLMRGDNEVYRAALAASPDASGQFAYLGARIVSEMTGYLLATPVILLRGLAAKADILALVGIFNWRRMFAYQGAVRQSQTLWLVLAPFLTLLIVGTLVTPNAFFAPVAIAFIHAYAIAYVSGRV